MISNDEYSKLLDQQFETKPNISANKIISGTILNINDQHVTVDIDIKAKGKSLEKNFLILDLPMTLKLDKQLKCLLKN